MGKKERKKSNYPQTQKLPCFSIKSSWPQTIIFSSWRILIISSWIARTSILVSLGLVLFASIIDSHSITRPWAFFQRVIIGTTIETTGSVINNLQPSKKNQENKIKAVSKKLVKASINTNMQKYLSQISNQINHNEESIMEIAILFP